MSRCICESLPLVESSTESANVQNSRLQLADSVLAVIRIFSELMLDVVINVMP